MSTVLLSRLLIADATLVIYKCNGTSSWRRAMSYQAMSGSTMPKKAGETCLHPAESSAGSP